MFKIQGTRLMILMPPRESKSDIIMTEGEGEVGYYKHLASKYKQLKVEQVGSQVTLVSAGDTVYLDPRTFENNLFYEDDDNVYMIIDERQIVGIY